MEVAMNQFQRTWPALAACIALMAFAACTPRPPTTGDDRCDPLVTEDCPQGQVCEAFADGENHCTIPVIIIGRIIATSDGSPIEGAIVQAVDINGAPAGTSVITGADGGYELVVPASRNDAGAPMDGVYTLRAQAAGYQEFPTALRPALPIDVTTAVQSDTRWHIESALTTIGLIALAGDTSALGSISGTVQASRLTSVLIVAEGGEDTYVGFSDSTGAYTIFNVPLGAYTVQGYAAGVQLEAAVVSLAADEDRTGVNLAGRTAALSTVSGNVQIVNAPGGLVTSVVLAIESTFDEVTARGQVPPGLRAGNVGGAFSIENVPDGRYVVLAAFENDDLVRDPDLSISGTDIIHIEVPDPVTGNTISISEGFKVTEALVVISPGADEPERVTEATPTLSWADDSSEDGYTLRVFDAFGNSVWQTELGPVTGSAEVSIEYAGTALEVGMFYQFRATSFREQGGIRGSISMTEDLKGVFFFSP